MRQPNRITYNQNSETGRSMVEMLGVIAIIGVLTVTAVIGLTYMLDKQKANDVIQDAHVIYISNESTRASHTEWITPNGRPKTDYPFFFKHDALGNTFVRVDAISQGVCQRILEQKGYPNLYFFSEKNQVMTTCPDKLNTIIFAFQGVDGIAIPCKGQGDCPSGISYCNDETGFCYICGKDYHLSPDGTQCLPNCTSEETSCLLNKLGWCCPKTLICGEKMGECIESDGLCSYEVSAVETIRQSDCSYEIENQEIIKQSNCSYEIANQEITKESNCSYEIANQEITKQSNCSSRVTSLKDGTTQVSTVQSCPRGQYCALQYEDKSCGKSVPSSKTGVIYGSCHKWTLSNNGCPIAEAKGQIAKAVQGCPRGQYCALQYEDKSCGKSVPSSKTGIIYGSCHKWTLSNNGCPITEAKGQIAKAVQGCPRGQYCALQYEDKSCGKSVPSSKTGVIYGSCHKWTLSNNGCPITEAKGQIAKAVQACPRGQYCALQYEDEGCGKSVPSSKTGIIYGSCHKWTLSNNGCPIMETKGAVVRAKHPCARTEYCALKWSDQNCSSLSSGQLGTIYGTCIPYSTNHALCPYR